MRFSVLFALFFLLFWGVIFPGIALSENVYEFSCLVTGEPGMNTYPVSPPGETTKLERPYKGAPPQVPHDVTEFIIKRDDNICLDCHLKGLELEHGKHVATKAPPSHFVNEFTKEKKEDQVAGIRYNCLQCHVPQAKEEFPFDPGGQACN